MSHDQHLPITAPLTDDQRAVDHQPAAAPDAAEDVDTSIVTAVIYPSIGVARVGNSPDEFVIGPEVNEPEALPLGAYRDAQGRLKRQAARFRVYGVNANGQIVRELTGPATDAEVTWQVQLANTKSAWYGFELALDIPEAASAPPTVLRNADVADRTQLAITPRQRAVCGPSAGPELFDDGAFMGTPVYLGEIRTDEAGRLLVLGGRGVSASHDGSRATTFANNEGWYDDVSDGPVTAQVSVRGRPVEVVPAWVVVGPPDYAPRRKSVRTMWDLMRDIAITSGALAAPARPSFSADILPILQRLSGLQWVNAGFAGGFGRHGAVDLSSADVLHRLSSPDQAYRELRQSIANSFRVFDLDGASPKPWPWLYGDAMNIPPVNTPRQNVALTATQLGLLSHWAQGSFAADYDPDRRPVRTLDEVPLTGQGDMLTRAALEFCLADAFHPGCEMTWPVRAASMYLAPFRFLHAKPDAVPPPLPAVLTYDSLAIPNGPLTAQQPGDITRWMAVPWQTDTASCRSGYQRAYDPYVPTFWPARVPNQVLTAENYAIAVDSGRDRNERESAFANRAAWIEPLGSVNYISQINNMVAGFDHLGVVEARPGPVDGLFPPVVEVEDQHLPIVSDVTDGATAIEALTVGPSGVAHASAADVDLSGIEKVNRFPGGLR